MSKRGRKRSKGYTVEMERAPIREVELEVKEVTEKLDKEKATFEFIFTNGVRFKKTVVVGLDYESYWYWKLLEKGDKVRGYVRVQNLINIDYA